MIVESMTKAELCKEVQADLDVLYDRIGGWEKKYHKKLINKKIPLGTTLDILYWESPRKNPITIFLVKSRLGVDFTAYFKCFIDCGLYKTPSFEWVYLFPTINGSTKVMDVDLIRTHSRDRLKEREGMDILQLMVDMKGCGYVCRKYDYNGRDDEYFASFGDKAAAILREHKWGYVWMTVITPDIMYPNQIELMRMCNQQLSATAKTEYGIDLNLQVA